MGDPVMIQVLMTLQLLLLLLQQHLLLHLLMGGPLLLQAMILKRTRVSSSETTSDSKASVHQMELSVSALDIKENSKLVSLIILRVLMNYLSRLCTKPEEWKMAMISS